ncbi:MAG: ferrous iron transporter B [Butyricicoccus sp.]|nr:ferrous iron transporter B [Butyricicoccus sp.]
MGLTHDSTGRHAHSGMLLDKQPGDLVIALLGNPNTGKSTVFNALTGLNQHTGNWSGKTVECARGSTMHRGKRLIFVDLPGTYSLSAKSPEEEVARDFLTGGHTDCTVIVSDATCLERNLNLVLQTAQLFPRSVLCLNLMDEARRKGICIDLTELQSMLGLPVVPCAAREGKGLPELLDTILATISGQAPCPVAIPYPVIAFDSTLDDARREEIQTASIVLRAEEIAGAVVKSREDTAKSRDRKIDRLLTSRATGIPVMLLLLAGILFLTITGANYPSELLSNLLFGLVPFWEAALSALHTPLWLHSLLLDGVWTILSSVVSVMLPPMAIFFPLFTLLEDVGYLPRVAFNLDHAFCRARTCGKQALTMCMGARWMRPLIHCRYGALATET